MLIQNHNLLCQYILTHTNKLPNTGAGLINRLNKLDKHSCKRAFYYDIFIALSCSLFSFIYNSCLSFVSDWSCVISLSGYIHASQTALYSLLENNYHYYGVKRRDCFAELRLRRYAAAVPKFKRYDVHLPLSGYLTSLFSVSIWSHN